MSQHSRINFARLFAVLRAMFDETTPIYDDFHEWRWENYQDLREGRRTNLPLKTWWPKYTDGDFRFELCLGALLVPQVDWDAVRICIENLRNSASSEGLHFSPSSLLEIPEDRFKECIRSSRFLNQKAARIRKLCQLLHREGMDSFFDQQNLGRVLTRAKCGFGPETRDCVLLYAANRPVFVADRYSRMLLGKLGSPVDDYRACQRIYQEGIRRDFDEEDLARILGGYTPEELAYCLPNSPSHPSVPVVLLYQQFHAGIDELGISGRWDELAEHYADRSGVIRQRELDPSGC